MRYHISSHNSGWLLARTKSSDTIRLIWIICFWIWWTYLKLIFWKICGILALNFRAYLLRKIIIPIWRILSRSIWISSYYSLFILLILNYLVTLKYILLSILEIFLLILKRILSLTNIWKLTLAAHLSIAWFLNTRLQY